MADIGHLPIPRAHHSPADCIGTAKHLVDQDMFSSILVLGEAEDGDLIFLSACASYAEACFLLERAKHLLLNPDRYSREQ